MFEKNMRIAYLLDFYGDLLDEHTSGVMKAYYNDDLSLSEVASDIGISRQGIRHLIKRGEEQLENYDEKLRLTSTYESIERALEGLCKLRATLADENIGESVLWQVDSVIDLFTKGS